MKLKSTQRKSLATVPSDYQGQERRFAQSVSESLDILTGRRGDIIDRAVTFRDLLDTGVLKLVKGLGTGSTGGGVSVTNPTTEPDGLPIQLPTQPENFVVSGGFGVIFLSWTLPPYNGHDYVEIYRLQRTTGAAEPTLAQAEAAGVYTRYYGDLYQFTDTNVGSQENWYYWIRAVNKNGIAGPYYSSTGVNATTALDYLYISGLIDDILDDDVSGLGLNTTLDALDLNITQLENFTGYSSTYNGDSLITRIGDVETVAGNAATSAQLQSEQTARANADSALAADITTLNATVYDTTTGVAATYSGLQSEITARANADSALSSSITSLTTTVNGNTASIQTNTSSINGVEAKYSVKVDNNGHVSGFGLISTANDSGTVTSAFIVAADRFAIASPYNSSSSANSNVGTNYPFKVFTTTTTVNGVAIPAGVYIDDAFIHDAQITDANIKDATITSAKIFDLSATRISSGNIAIDNSNNIAIFQGKRTFSYYDSDLQKNVYVPNFNSTASGFVLGNNNGNPVFHVGNATRFMKFDGATGDLTTTGLEVRASDGTVLVDAGGLRAGSGGQLAYNGDFHKNQDGWTAFNGTGGSGSASISGGVAYCGYQQYFKQATQRFPVTRGEKLYVYGWSNVQGTSSTGMRLGATFYSSSDPTVSSGSTGTVYAGGNGTGATQLSIEYDSSIGQYFAIGVITVPNSGNSRYAEFRFGNLNYSGTISYIGVGISRTPPAIGPNYASTYIRNLSVDTLQIADNAVTVPATIQYGSSGYFTNGVETVISASTLAVNFGSNVPDKVICLALSDLGSSGLGGDWAAAVLRLRYNTTNSTTISGSGVIQGVQVNSRKGAPPSLNLSTTVNGWSGTRYFFLTMVVTGETNSATGWWRNEDANISILGAKK